MTPDTKIGPLKDYFEILSRYFEEHGFFLVMAHELPATSPDPKWALKILDRRSAGPEVLWAKTGSLAMFLDRTYLQLQHGTRPELGSTVTFPPNLQGEVTSFTQTKSMTREDTFEITLEVSRRPPTPTFTRKPIWT